MAISQNQREILQRAQGNCSTALIATAMESLFPVKLTAQRQTPLIDDATEFFAKHWAGAAGKEVLVPAHNSLEPVTRIYAK